MNYILDLVLVVVFVVIVLISYLRGFAKSAWRLISVVTSSLLSFLFGSKIGRLVFLKFWEEKLPDFQKPELLSDICGYLGLFLLTSIIMAVIGIFIKKAAEAPVLSTLDSFLGLVFGIVIGLIYVFVVCLVVSLVVELKMNLGAIEYVKIIAEESYVFRFFCDISPYEYTSITSVFSSGIFQ